MFKYGLVNTIQASTLAKTTQPEPIRFETDFAAYKYRLNDIKAGRTSNWKIKAAATR